MDKQSPNTEKTRGRPKRNWVKIDCHGILSGSINYQYNLSEQAIWVKMIAYSAVCGGPPGSICDNDGRGMPLDFVAHELHCPLDLLESTISKGIEEGRIKSNGTGAIIITNFDAYQFTEYDRQRPYRLSKKVTENNEPDKFKQGTYGHMVKSEKRKDTPKIPNK